MFYRCNTVGEEGGLAVLSIGPPGEEGRCLWRGTPLAEKFLIGLLFSFNSDGGGSAKGIVAACASALRQIILFSDFEIGLPVFFPGSAMIEGIFIPVLRFGDLALWCREGNRLYIRVCALMVVESFSICGSRCRERLRRGKRRHVVFLVIVREVRHFFGIKETRGYSLGNDDGCRVFG